MHSSTIFSCGTSRDQTVKISMLINRLAFTEQTPDGRFGVRRLQQRAVGAALDPAHDDLGIGLEPDRDRLVANPISGFLAHERAAAGRDYAWAVVEQSRDHPRLAVPEIRLAASLENIRDRHACRGLDFGIGVQKRQPQPRRQPPSDGGFAGPHHPHQHDRTRSQRRGNFGVLGCAGAGRYGCLRHLFARFGVTILPPPIRLPECLATKGGTCW